jgi:hypothetical protein
LHELLIYGRVSEEGYGFLSNWQISFLVGGCFGDDLVGWGWGCAHEEIGRVAAAEHLGKLLEV